MQSKSQVLEEPKIQSNLYSVLPHVPLAELTERRQKLADLLPKSSLILLPANPVLIRNSDIELPFRQESMFWYFTGINDPDCLLIIYKDVTGKTNFYLHIQPIDEDNETWNGKRLKKDQACDISGLLEVEYFSSKTEKINKTISHLLSKTRFFYKTEADRLNQFYEAICPNILTKNSSSSVKLQNILAQLRMYKSDWEIEQLKKAADINIKAHLAAKNYLKTAKNPTEFGLQAELEYVWKQHGLTFSYPPIVASSNNATTLHYIQNNQAITSPFLVLVDAGCEYNYYASDITRTYTFGEILPAQKFLHEMVQKAHQKAIKTLNSSTVTLQEIHQKVTLVLIEEMLKAGILTGSIQEILQSGDYFKYWPHSTSHWLGLDTHDFGVYKNLQKEPIALENGMVFTIEPGIYIPKDAQKDNPNLPSEFCGIGIRLEDNIVITEDGFINLTQDLAL